MEHFTRMQLRKRGIVMSDVELFTFQIKVTTTAQNDMGEHLGQSVGVSLFVHARAKTSIFAAITNGGVSMRGETIVEFNDKDELFDALDSYNDLNNLIAALSWWGYRTIFNPPNEFELMQIEDRRAERRAAHPARYGSKEENDHYDKEQKKWSAWLKKQKQQG